MHVALLRGVNVGGRHKLPMASLRTWFEEAGASHVRTFIQSGNVVFRADAAEEVAECVVARIGEELGFTPPILLRTAVELAAVVAGNPFAGEDPAFLHAMFLTDEPEAARVAALDRSGRDRFEVVGRTVYLHTPEGLGRNDLPDLDRKLKVATTTRNWRTTLALLDLASGPPE